MINFGHVILVNEEDEVLGSMEKLEVHRKALLHRAISVFIFNQRGEMLLQQRAVGKYHCGGLWTNTCCSHPAPGEQTTDAASRRLQEEMGFTTSIEKIFSFVYRSEFENGLTEYEYDHVFAGVYDGIIAPDYREVKDFCYKSIKEIETSLTSHPDKYTVWFHIAFPKVKQWAEETILQKTGV